VLVNTFLSSYLFNHQTKRSPTGGLALSPQAAQPSRGTAE
jgi:hypothetical protein